jgi:hypothetical protein
MHAVLSAWRRGSRLKSFNLKTEQNRNICSGFVFQQEYYFTRRERMSSPFSVIFGVNLESPAPSDPHPLTTHPAQAAA